MVVASANNYKYITTASDVLYCVPFDVVVVVFSYRRSTTWTDNGKLYEGFEREEG